MNYQRHNLTLTDKLFGSTAMSDRQAAVIKQAYLLLGVAVFCAMAGGYIGATTPAIVQFFSSKLGWIAAIVLLNVVPYIAMALRHNPVLGVTALVFDGFLGGLAISPLLYVAATFAPTMIVAAIMITGAVFLGVTGYLMVSGKSFSAPRGLMIGMFFAITAAVILNSFMNIGVLGILISVAIGAFGVFSLVYGTSTVLNSPDADSPIPGALSLYSSLFNIFVSVLNLLLRLFGGRR